MRLRLEEIGPKLPTTDVPQLPAEIRVDEGDLWRDSTMDLERGLDVVELPGDVVNPVPPFAPHPSAE